MISLTVLGRTLQKILNAYHQLFFRKLIHHWELLIQLYQDWKLCHEKKTFCKEPIQMRTTQYLDSFVSYR